MKICILGDTHFGARGDSLDFHKYFKRFYNEIFFPYLKENKIDTIVQMGDLFDRRKFINFNSLYLSRRYFFDICKEDNITVHTLIGNHDVAFKNTLDVNSPSLVIKDYDNVKVYQNFATINIDGLDIDIVPWICDENEKEIFDKIKTSRSEVCFGHFEISGFEMDRGNVCEVGIDKKELKRYDVVLSGHFHHKSSDGNITYVGTPYEMTWADYSDPKGFHIFDTETRELEFVKNPITMFNKVFYNDSETDFEHWKKYDFNSLKETYVKVVVVNKQNPYLFDHVIDNFYKAGVADLAIVEDFSDVLINDDQELIDQAEDTMTILSKYIDNLPLDVEPEKLKAIMRELYIEAINTEVAE
jgi:DNA repair exonuclease SbcCD nuclease subunit